MNFIDQISGVFFCGTTFNFGHLPRYPLVIPLLCMVSEIQITAPNYQSEIRIRIKINPGFRADHCVSLYEHGAVHHFTHSGHTMGVHGFKMWCIPDITSV